MEDPRNSKAASVVGAAWMGQGWAGQLTRWERWAPSAWDFGWEPREA